MNSFLQQFKDLGAAKISVIIGVAIILLCGLLFLSMRLSSPSMGILYSQLEQKDMGQVVSVLGSRGVPYQITDNGSTVMVPANDVLSLRMVMAAEGIPAGGSIVGYEIFDQSDSLGTSNFVNNVKLHRALEGELGRTISSFAQVESARVHLVIPKKELFSKEKRAPTASIVLQLKGNAPLEKQKIRAISYLVATAVPNLKASNITIVDTNGAPLQLANEDAQDPGLITSRAAEYRINYERHLSRTIETLLEKYVGTGRIRAEVAAEIDFDRVIKNSESYDPDGQVVRSVQTIEERANSSEGNSSENVSVTTNLPNNESSKAGATSGSNSERIDETTNFEISKTVTNHVSETGTVKRLSIAVLVDGKYVEDEGSSNLLGENELKYVERTADELAQLESLVKSAVGYDVKRGDVVKVINLQFSTKVRRPEKEKPFDWLKAELQNILQTLVIGIVVILIIMLVIRPLANRAFEMGNKDVDEDEFQAALSGAELDDPIMGFDQEEEDAESMIDLGRIEDRVKNASLSRLNDIITSSTDDAVSLIRSWLSK